MSGDGNLWTCRRIIAKHVSLLIVQLVPQSNLVPSHKVIRRAATDYDSIRDSISAVSVSKTAVSSFLDYLRCCINSFSLFLS
jgi:hypothetical protein